AGGDADAPRGLHGLAPGADRERGVHAPPARHLRRADGFGISLRQVRLANLARRMDQRQASDRLGVRALARARRGHLGGTRWATGVLVLACDVLGGRRSRHPTPRQPIVPPTPRTLAPLA